MPPFVLTPTTLGAPVERRIVALFLLLALHCRLIKIRPIVGSSELGKVLSLDGLGQFSAKLAKADFDIEEDRRQTWLFLEKKRFKWFATPTPRRRSSISR